MNKLGGPGLIMQFVEGKKPVPDAVLLKAVDYVLDEFPASKPAGN